MPLVPPETPREQRLLAAVEQRGACTGLTTTAAGRHLAAAGRGSGARGAPNASFPCCRLKATG
eukprot:5739687-Lingulodinium_polyedra.AAC.1